MFKIYLLFFGISVPLALALLIFPCHNQAHEEYARLLQVSKQVHKQDAKQLRSEVSKQIWYQDNTPLHIRIESPQSELFFTQHNNQVEVIEQLGNVICIMQEELYYEGDQPMQKVRYMEGEHARYHYNSRLFIAHNVKLWQYEIEGHTPPEVQPIASSIMSATADSVEFVLKNEALDFTACHMRAIFNTEKL
jgi:hypothetical protein